MALKIIDKISKLPKDPLNSYSKRTLSKIDKIIIHHSATPRGSVEAFARHHVENNGWPGIGYHYVIDTDGTIYKTQALSTISYHTSGHNSKSVGICLIGDFETFHPSPEAWNSCVALIKELMRVYKNIVYVLGHKEVGSKTKCPGKKFDTNKLREDIKK